MSASQNWQWMGLLVCGGDAPQAQAQAAPRPDDCVGTVPRVEGNTTVAEPTAPSAPLPDSTDTPRATQQEPRTCGTSC